MCLWTPWPIEDSIEFYVVHDDSLDDLLEKYIRLSDFFDASNIFLSESNIKFGRLNYIEGLILAKKPITKRQKELYKIFVACKTKIDTLINPKEPEEAKEVPKNEPQKRIDIIDNNVTLYKMNKTIRKYTSVLTVTRSDIHGFEATKLST